MGEYVKCQDLLDEVIRIEEALLIEMCKTLLF